MNYIDAADLQTNDTVFLSGRKGWYTVKFVRTVEDRRGFTMEVTFRASEQNGTDEFCQRFDPDGEPFLASDVLV